MKFILPGPETITLSGQTVDKLIRAGDGDAALLYLYILKTRGQGTAEEAAREICRSAAEIDSAMTVLDRLGLVRYGGGEVREPEPQAVQEPDEVKYTIGEVRQELENGTEFSFIVDEAQRSLGKLLSPDDLVRLFGIYDNLRLPPEVILHLIMHCIVESRGKSGGGRMPTLRYIEKAAYTWEREGIFTLERAEEHIKKLEQRKSSRGEVKAALQIKDRELSATERRYIDGWIEMGFKADAIELAYDRTVMKTGKLAWGYMDSIIKSWHGKGLFSPADIEARDGKQAPKQQPARQADSKYGAPNQEDIERMKRLLERIKEE